MQGGMNCSLGGVIHNALWKYNCMYEGGFIFMGFVCLYLELEFNVDLIAVLPLLSWSQDACHCKPGVYKHL